jgi:tetratricopeptide (TPR) repeat protein
MMARNARRWITTLLVVAGWTLASGVPSYAQETDPAQSGSPPESARTDSDRSFDASITVPELFEKARQAFGMNKIDLAAEFYREILIRDRTNVQAMMELSNVYERSGRLEYARGLLIRSSKLLPGNEDIADRLAAVEHMLAIVLSAEVDSLLANQLYELALPKLSVHLNIEPDSPELLYKRALCYSHLGRPDAALSSVDRALQINPIEKYYKLRSLLLKDLKTMESREKMAEVKSLLQTGEDSAHGRALEVLGEILQKDPDHKWARAEFVRLSAAGATDADTTGSRSVQEIALSATSAVAAVARGAGRLAARHLSAILLLVAAIIIFRSPLTRLITRWLAPRSFLSGRFPKFTLTEILITLNSESHTGILQVKGDGCRGKIYIENGEPCHCVVGKLQGVNALHHLISNTGDGNFEFADGSIPLSRTIDTPLSVVLVDQESGGPGRAAQRRKRVEARTKKSKSRMKELLESRSDK